MRMYSARWIGRWLSGFSWFRYSSSCTGDTVRLRWANDCQAYHLSIDVHHAALNHSVNQSERRSCDIHHRASEQTPLYFNNRPVEREARQNIMPWAFVLDA